MALNNVLEQWFPIIGTPNPWAYKNLSGQVCKINSVTDFVIILGECRDAQKHLWA